MTKRLSHIDGHDIKLLDEYDLLMVVMKLVAMVTKATTENAPEMHTLPFSVCLLHGYIKSDDIIL